MIELAWFEAFPPADASLTDVTGMVRVLAARPHLGLLALQPVVAFELWMTPERFRWLVGVDSQIGRTLPDELRTQLPGLTLVPAARPQRPAPITAREIRVTSMIYPLRRDAAQAVTAGLVRMQTVLGRTEALVLQWVVGPSMTSTQPPGTATLAHKLGFGTPRKPDGEDRTAWRSKLAEPLFGVRGRVGAVTGDRRRAAELLVPMVSALGLAGAAHARVYGRPQSSQTAGQLVQVVPRLRTWSTMVNASELVMLMGWCLGGLEVPGAAGGFAAPPAGLLAPRLGIRMVGARPLGTSIHPASQGREVALPPSSFSTHVHLIGPSGRGKSTLLGHWILGETTAGRSVVVVEPKGDLIVDVLARLPREHPNVVVIDPGASGPVVGFNPLAGSQHDAERRADSLLHLFRQLFGSAIGPRSADVLLHALIMAARLDDGCLTDVPILLSANSSFRRRAAARVSDPLTIAPWLAWFDNLSDPERAQVVAPVLNKLRVLTTRPAIRRLLGQAHPRFDLASVFRQPTLVLVNLNAGAMGPETSRLLASLLLGQLYEAIQRQTTLPAEQRRPLSVYVDEWQTATAGLDFSDALARSRGANCTFTLSHQHLDQLSSELREAVLANAGARVVFRPAEGDGRALARVLGAPATPENLERLAAYHAVARVLVDGAPCSPFEVATPPLGPATTDPDEVRRSSAERYGVDPARLDAELLARWQGGDKPNTPVGARRASQ